MSWVGLPVPRDRSDRHGICRLCGFEGKLSFEHVPPRAAFNRNPLVLTGINELRGRDLDDVRGRTQQKGAGAYTLCERCNNHTGHWYGEAYVEWARQALMIIRATEGCATLYYSYRISPLRVLKQIVCMFLSANSRGFTEAHPDLIKFVLDPERHGMDPRLQIFAFLNGSNRGRQAGLSALGQLGPGRITLLSEVTFPPFGFVMCVGSPAPDPRLVDITFFAKYRYRDASDLFIALPVLPVYSPYPGDYRARETVLDTARRAQTTLAANGHKPPGR